MTIKDLNDAEIKEFVRNLLKQNKYGIDNPAGKSTLDSYIDYVELVQKRLAEIEPGFSQVQATLKSMNVLRPKIYNPYTPIMPPPQAGGIVTDSFDEPKLSSNFQDPIRDATEGFYIRVTNTGTGPFVDGPKLLFDGKKIEKYNEEINLFSKEKPRDEYHLLDLEDPQLTGKPGMKVFSPMPGVEYDVPDYEVLFEKRKIGPGFLNEDKGHQFFKPKAEKFVKTQTQIQSERAVQDFDVFVTREDFEQGFVENSLAELMPDNALYIPFYFEDLRKPSRRIYFRAFLTNFSETISPEWSTEKYYGRVDPVGMYKNTTRMFSIGFIIASMSPAGFSTMWKKINNLSKMFYPTFKNGVMSRSPVLRVRVGDVLCDGFGVGLPGFPHTALELDYSGTPWEISNFTGPSTPGTIEVGKAPMMAKVSFGFTVIHEENPELDEEYNMKQVNFRRIGTTIDFWNESEEESNLNPLEVEDSTDNDTGIS